MEESKNLLEVLKDTKRRLPGIGELAQTIVEQFGGFQKLAEEFKAVYDKCKDKPMIQAKMLEGIMDSMKQASEKSRQADLASLSQEQLMEILAGVLEKRNG